MVNAENIGGVYILTNPYGEFHPCMSKCKNRYKTPIKKAKATKKAKVKKRMSKQSRKCNR